MIDEFTFLLRDHSCRVSVSRTATLADLSREIFAAVYDQGFEDHQEHLHQFRIGGNVVVSPETEGVLVASLNLALDGKLSYTWDLGDWYELPLVVKGVPDA